MKRYITLLSGILLLISTFTYSSCSSAGGKEQERINNELSVPALLTRNSKVGNDAERAMIQTTYDKAIAALKNNPDDLKQFISLASVYISEGRITGNSGYYSNAAIKVLNRITNEHAANKELEFEALNLKSVVLLNMHQFKEAVAEQAVAINSINSGIYGALVDANVEMGHYDAAVKDCDKMLGLRPDLRSYSRASYLRQIYGDNKGAIAAMKMAVEAGGPGDESTEWARVMLGNLYLNTGNNDSASFAYRTSLMYRPEYPYALAGLAKVAQSEKNYDSAIALTKHAIKLMSQPMFVLQLADLYELKSDTAKASEVRNDVITLLLEGEKDQADQVVKHNTNRELAMAYIEAGQANKAIPYALKDLAMRPDNIDANELAAWAYYKSGKYAEAQKYAAKSMRTNSKNAISLYRNGMIYAAAGDPLKGDQLMQEAKSILPGIDQKTLLAAK